MNERIKELEKQSFITTETQKISGAWDNTVEPFRYVTVTETNFSLEKFAELIVKECAELVKDQLKVIPADQKDWDGHNYGYTAAVYESLDRFKEHFGVEE